MVGKSPTQKPTANWKEGCESAGVTWPTGTGTADTACGSGGSDPELWISRRLDWRFLLPDPELRHVGLLGFPDADLIMALTRFSSSVAALGDDESQRHGLAGQPEVDLAVVHSRRYADLEVASRVLTRGAYLYWEIPWSVRSLFFRGPHSGKEVGALSDYRGLLVRLGFHEIQFHWHYPDFRATRSLVPLNDGSAIRHFFSHNGSGPLKVAGRALGWILGKNDKLFRLFPCVSAVGRKA